MPRLMSADLLRILAKRSLYAYFGGLAAAYALIAYIRSGGFDAMSVVGDATNAFGLLPALVGGYLFSSVVLDDLGSGLLASLVGHGLGKVRIVLSKAALLALLSTLAFGLAAGWLLACHALLGWPAAPSALRLVALVALRYLLVTVGAAAVASSAAYGLQRPTFAMVLYILLSLNVIGGLISAFLRLVIGGPVVEAILDRLLAGIADRLFISLLGATSPWGPLLEYLLYVGLALAVATSAFVHKETEFKP